MSAPGGRSRPPRPRSWTVRVIAGVLLASYPVLALTAIRGKSLTFDELGHLTGGCSYWLTEDYRLFPQNGKLPTRWATLPLIFGEFQFPSRDQPAWRAADVQALGYQFLFTTGNDPDRMLWLGRLMMVPLGTLLAWVAYRWSSQLHGPRGGLVTLALFAFSPAFLAHGPLVTSDVAAALFFTAALAAWWSVLHRVTVVRLVGSSLLMGALFVTKFSAVLMIPVALVLLGIRVGAGRPLVIGRGRRILRGRWQAALVFSGVLLTHAVVVVGVIWACHGFRYGIVAAQASGPASDASRPSVERAAPRDVVGAVLRAVRDHRLLPEAYVYGFAHVLAHSRGHYAFLNGECSSRGWWYYFPYCVLVKTPLPFFGLLVLSAAAAACRWRVWPVEKRDRELTARRVRRAAYRTAPLWVFAAVYWVAAVSSGLNIGERHVLPTYPAAFILAGAAGDWLKRRSWRVGACTGALVLLFVLESARIHPHYLAYFNQVAGGPARGYRHLVDSSLDWGQDLPGLKRWLEEHAAADGGTEVYLSYFGCGSPVHAGIRAKQLFSYEDWREHRPLHPLQGGLYCISATMLQSVYNPARGRWTPEYERAYGRVLAEVERLELLHGESAPGQRPASHEQARVLLRFEQLRLARLCASLRQREPDDHVGYSILIYRLSDEEVRAALGPAEGVPAWDGPDNPR